MTGEHARLAVSNSRTDTSECATQAKPIGGLVPAALFLIIVGCWSRGFGGGLCLATAGLLLHHWRRPWLSLSLAKRLFEIVYWAGVLLCLWALWESPEPPVIAALILLGLAAITEFYWSACALRCETAKDRSHEHAT